MTSSYESTLVEVDNIEVVVYCKRAFSLVKSSGSTTGFPPEMALILYQNPLSKSKQNVYTDVNHFVI